MEPLGPDEAEELMEWVLHLPPDDEPTEGDAGQTRPISRRLTDVLTGPWRWWTATARRRRQEVLYGDSIVSMRDDDIVIKRYYWPAGKKRIRYEDIRNVSVRPLKAWHGQFRVHGIDHRGRWYSRDRHRGEKERAIDLTVGWLIHPVLTPDDIDKVLDILDTKVTIAPG